MAPSIQPSMAWTLVFVPALCFFLATRMSQAGFRFGSSYGQSMGAELLTGSENLCPSVFYCNNLLELNYGLYQVQATGLGDIVASAWRHDSELGRGYLLLSDAAEKGRVWRWEVGGGPIAIGRTLHLEDSGCRSPKCLAGEPKGSGGLAMDFRNQEHAAEGLLVVAEWGEGRIARLEENGARTPLVLQLPDLCAAEKTIQVQEPSILLYTPTGDLVFTEFQSACGKSALMRLPNAMHVPALQSLQESRVAHEWTELDGDLPEVMVESPNRFGGLVLAPTFRSVCVTEKQDGSVLLKQIMLPVDENDAEDFLHDKSWFENWQVFNLTAHFATVRDPAPIAISQEGRVFVVIPGSIAIIDPAKGRVLGSLSTPDIVPTSLTFGEDGFLYITSSTSLYRVNVREKPVLPPVNLIRTIPKKKI